MKRNWLLLLSCLSVIALSVNFACSKSDSPSGGDKGGSDGQDSVLLNIGNNIILPAYQSLATATDALDVSITAFAANPTGNTLTEVQTKFKTAYLAWQVSSSYNYIGPTMDAQPAFTGLNIFPTNASLIDKNITEGNMDVNSFANTVAKGFPALDYLLFAPTNDLAAYTTGPGATNRKKYLSAVSTDIKTEIDNIFNKWKSDGGNYIKTFNSGSGNSVSSSLGLLLNSLNRDFEILKNDRLGIPLGKIPVGSTDPINPTQVEAYYSGISGELAVAQIQAVQGIFLGNGGKGNGKGLINNLIAVNAKYGDGALSDTIKAALALGIKDLQAIQDPFSKSIQTNTPVANAAFSQCQKLVALMKTDMPSALGVLITYGDNDGD